MTDNPLLGAAEARAAGFGGTLGSYFTTHPDRLAALRGYIAHLRQRGAYVGGETVREDFLGVWPDLPGSPTTFRRFLKAEFDWRDPS